MPDNHVRGTCEEEPMRGQVKSRGRHPWDSNPQLKTTLAVTAWRYASLVGVVDPEPAIGITPTVVKADRCRFPEYVRRDSEGLPVFDAREGAAFMHAITALPVPLCREWLAHDWQT
jgi:hypothetical protein